ncbi:hypothetical protein L905_19070 [Agrobacterium sp. TS43]|uniref:hypothetical protein n=1 Tax=Agrobacterium TaxID=357 RepID=UPI0007459D4C|nr:MULTISPECIES: hypothetical protein [Agrobacterium]KVK49494.1 hypothetical protein L903_19425 [Agrobacterium sp. JL28]KVK49731.1 hypothetical protein L904_19415 [Agrobacterium sp. LY4]KVK62673.1 hypothetical protein L906_18545 [Agrobacterium sp. TS45]KVK65058.1 hypothetical protein L905_19070 [Agrobacterium sp. TS43]KVK67123.1 hypothetical protein L907_18520 [Agrobacterium sp. C13]
MDGDTKQTFIVTLAVMIVLLAFIHGCTAVVTNGSNNRIKLACIERGNSWSEGNCS